jgi:membrane protein YqaA with SNARE-associated domain
MFKPLDDWTFSLASIRRASQALAVVSFPKSSFFPVPPDVMLVPMMMARPEKAWTYAAICTIASVLGALFGYAIGALLYDSVGAWLMSFYGYGDKMESFRALYQQHGHWIILIKGLTPIPFKLVTIASGLAGYDLFWFIVLCLITRAGRLYVAAGVMNRFGGPLRRLIENNLTLVGIVSVMAILLGFAAAKVLF